MSEFSDVERHVYETLRLNTAEAHDQWIDIHHVHVHLPELERSELQETLHDLNRAGLITVDGEKYRPSDHDRRRPHPGEIEHIK
jgi:hypothetical protein